MYVKTEIGEDGYPHGVEGAGSDATGVNGGEGSEESPVPPMIAIWIGSLYVVGNPVAIL